MGAVLEEAELKLRGICYETDGNVVLVAKEIIDEGN